MSEELLDATGKAAPPRVNGELVFQAPWERRVFGLTLGSRAAGGPSVLTHAGPGTPELQAIAMQT